MHCIHNGGFKEFVNGLIVLADIYIGKTNAAHKGVYIDVSDPKGNLEFKFAYGDGNHENESLTSTLEEIPDGFETGSRVSINFGGNYAVKYIEETIKDYVRMYANQTGFHKIEVEQTENHYAHLRFVFTV